MSLVDIVKFHNETKRQKSQYDKILDLFEQRGSLTNLDLAKVCYRYSARLGELRKSYKIAPAEYLKPGVFLYVFKGAKAKHQSKKLARSMDNYEKEVMSYEINN